MYDVAVVTPTIIHRGLDRAVKSVFEQDFEGRIQMLVGLDYPCGNKEDLWALQIQAPTNVQLDVLHMGYSTRKDKGGLYYSYGGGALRTILTFAANSRYVAYLDDDNWYEPDHLSTLMELIKSKDYDWVYSDRYPIDPDTDGHLPQEIFMAKPEDGMVDTNCILIDKIKCHKAIHGWALPLPQWEVIDGIAYADDFRFTNCLKENGLWNRGTTGLKTVAYRVHPDRPYLPEHIKRKRVKLIKQARREDIRNRSQ